MDVDRKKELMKKERKKELRKKERKKERKKKITMGRTTYRSQRHKHKWKCIYIQLILKSLMQHGVNS